MVRTNVYVRNIFWFLLCFGFAVSIAQASNPVNGNYIVTITVTKDSTSVPQERIDSYCRDGMVCWAEYSWSDKNLSYYRIMGTSNPVCSETETWNGTECVEDTQQQCSDGQVYNGSQCVEPPQCSPDSPDYVGSINNIDICGNPNDACQDGWTGGFVNGQFTCINPDDQPPTCDADGVVIITESGFVCESPTPNDSDTNDSDPNDPDPNDPDPNDPDSNNPNNPDSNDQQPRDPRDPESNSNVSDSETINNPSSEASKSSCYANGVYIDECYTEPTDTNSCKIRQGDEWVTVDNCTPSSANQSCVVGDVTYQNCEILPGGKCYVGEGASKKLMFGCSRAPDSTSGGDSEQNTGPSAVFSPSTVGKGDLYIDKDQDQTVETVMGRFKQRLINAPVYATATNFFQVNVAGSCPRWTIPGVMGMGAVTIDFQCSAVMDTILALVKYIMIATAAFIAFRWAFL